MSNRQIPRSWIAAASILVLYAVATRWKGPLPAESAALRTDTPELPRRLGAWSADDTITRPDLVTAPEAARTAVHRSFRHATEGTIAVTLDVLASTEVLDRYLVETVVEEAGASVLEQADFLLPHPQGADTTTHLLTVAAQGHRRQVLYWYQVGTQVVCDRVQIYGTRRRALQAGHLPPLIRVTLQMTATDSVAAGQRLRSLGGPLLAWTQQIQ